MASKWYRYYIREIDKALQLDQFKECDHKFDNIKEAISFLENQYIEMLKGFGVVKPSTENFKELLKYADEDVYINYLERIKNELIPNKKFGIAKIIATDIRDLSNENSDIKNMAKDILWEIKYPNLPSNYPLRTVVRHAEQVQVDGQILKIAA